MADPVSSAREALRARFFSPVWGCAKSLLASAVESRSCSPRGARVCATGEQRAWAAAWAAGSEPDVAALHESHAARSRDAVLVLVRELWSDDVRRFVRSGAPDLLGYSGAPFVVSAFREVLGDELVSEVLYCVVGDGWGILGGDLEAREVAFAEAALASALRAHSCARHASGAIRGSDLLVPPLCAMIQCCGVSVFAVLSPEPAPSADLPIPVCFARSPGAQAAWGDFCCDIGVAATLTSTIAGAGLSEEPAVCVCAGFPFSLLIPMPGTAAPAEDDAASGAEVGEAEKGITLTLCSQLAFTLPGTPHEAAAVEGDAVVAILDPFLASVDALRAPCQPFATRHLPIDVRSAAPSRIGEVLRSYFGTEDSVDGGASGAPPDADALVRLPCPSGVAFARVVRLVSAEATVCLPQLEVLTRRDLETLDGLLTRLELLRLHWWRTGAASHEDQIHGLLEAHVHPDLNLRASLATGRAIYGRAVLVMGLKPGHADFHPLSLLRRLSTKPGSALLQDPRVRDAVDAAVQHTREYDVYAPLLRAVVDGHEVVQNAEHALSLLQEHGLHQVTALRMGLDVLAQGTKCAVAAIPLLTAGLAPYAEQAAAWRVLAAMGANGGKGVAISARDANLESLWSSSLLHLFESSSLSARLWSIDIPLLARRTSLTNFIIGRRPACNLRQLGLVCPFQLLCRLTKLMGVVPDSLETLGTLLAVCAGAAEQRFIPARLESQQLRLRVCAINDWSVGDSPWVGTTLPVLDPQQLLRVTRALALRPLPTPEAAEDLTRTLAAVVRLFTMLLPRSVLTAHLLRDCALREHLPSPHTGECASAEQLDLLALQAEHLAASVARAVPLVPYDSDGSGGRSAGGGSDVGSAWSEGKDPEVVGSEMDESPAARLAHAQRILLLNTNPSSATLVGPSFMLGSGATLSSACAEIASAFEELALAAGLETEEDAGGAREGPAAPGEGSETKDGSEAGTADGGRQTAAARASAGRSGAGDGAGAGDCAEVPASIFSDSSWSEQPSSRLVDPEDLLRRSSRQLSGLELDVATAGGATLPRVPLQVSWLVNARWASCAGGRSAPTEPSVPAVELIAGSTCAVQDFGAGEWSAYFLRPAPLEEGGPGAPPGAGGASKVSNAEAAGGQQASWTRCCPFVAFDGETGCVLVPVAATVAGSYNLHAATAGGSLRLAARVVVRPAAVVAGRCTLQLATLAGLPLAGGATVPVGGSVRAVLVTKDLFGNEASLPPGSQVSVIQLLGSQRWTIQLLPCAERPSHVGGELRFNRSGWYTISTRVGPGSWEHMLEAGASVRIKVEEPAPPAAAALVGAAAHGGPMATRGPARLCGMVTHGHSIPTMICAACMRGTPFPQCARCGNRVMIAARAPPAVACMQCAMMQQLVNNRCLLCSGCFIGGTGTPAVLCQACSIQHSRLCCARK